MRVNPIYTYNRFISAPKNKQVSFGLIENEENTKRVLPKNSDYRIPFDKQWQCLKDHDAVTVTSEGNKAWARINPGFDDMYDFLAGKGFIKRNYLTNLEGQDRFDSFYYTLQSIDYDRKYPHGSGIDCGGCTVESKSSWEEDLESGFGVKIW